ncbi:MAG: hypothetical protein PHE06_11620 [Lachnospiraceae bacterium]|nr:hypothetical protein [Lachnospiraceae bacterium]MDD3796591.1 hypothetical protein [Lachnospiraceae bacterium]
MNAGRVYRFAAVIMCTLTLSACSLPSKNEWKPEETSLQVKKDGTLTETVIDQLDETYYNSQELESMIKSSVSEYNQKHGADAITVTALTLENNQVNLTLDYKSAEDYADYNNVKFYNGSMLGAEMDGYLFYNTFKQVDEGTVTKDQLSNEEPLKHKEYQVLVTDLLHVVQVPGDVVYVSENGYPADERVVKPSGESAAKDGENELVLPSDTAYVPEEDTAAVSTTDLEKTYLYIIYEF